jgi:hypothetical protein
MSSSDRRGEQALGTCFGFGVSAPLAFRYLREGTGDPIDVSVDEVDPDVDRGELVLRWDRERNNPIEAQLYRAADGRRYSLWVEGTGWFQVDPESGRVTVPPCADVVRREERLWGIPALMLFLQRGDVPLHAGAVEVDGQAVLLAGPTRAGKTTLMAGFARAGYRVLTEDLACIRMTPDPMVIPGPAMIRVRPDVARELAVPGATPVQTSAERVHLALPPETRGDCTPVPLAAVMFLHDTSSGISFTRVDAPRALADLWTLSFRINEPADLSRCFTSVVDLAGRVALWELRRPLTLQHLAPTVEAVADHVTAR